MGNDAGSELTLENLNRLIDQIPGREVEKYDIQMVETSDDLKLIMTGSGGQWYVDHEKRRRIMYVPIGYFARVQKVLRTVMGEHGPPSGRITTFKGIPVLYPEGEPK